ncbi:peptidoglycan recognition protein-like [Leguminivora glycinivorella]|uniref:peptidoglycan recognition protein-like n=1 Tax=Leguminivora glycinivorella TaxID=1035111 RepID=UPI00200C07F4|nr:peptidoglycan recognition protein-like [Leguminivora glycinivorella]
MSLIAVLLVLIKLCAAQDNECGVVPMTQWVGQASQRTEPLANPVDLVIIQHSVYGACATDEACEKAVRGIREYHINKKGFTDIGESFLIGGNGKVYEGAGWSLVGAHTKLYNNRSIGISFLGDFRKTLPTSEALQAVKDLISCGVSHNFLAQDYRLVGHQQVVKTESPGTELQKEIQAWPHWAENV